MDMNQQDLEKYYVKLNYTESNPRNRGKVYSIDYTIEADDADDAVKLALAQFNGYQNFQYASWIRRVIPSQTEVSGYIEQRKINELDEIEILKLFKKYQSIEMYRLLVNLKYLPEFLKMERIIRRIKECMVHQEPRIRIAAFNCLKSSGIPEANELFVKQLADETSEYIRATIITSLGLAGDSEYIDVVKKFLFDSDDRVRANAVESMMWLDAREYLSDIAKLIEDSNNRVRANVLVALEKLGGLNHRDNLLLMLNSDNEFERASALYAAGEMGNSEQLELIEPGLDDSVAMVRRNAVSALLKLNPSPKKYCKRLFQMLNDSNQEVVKLVVDYFFNYSNEFLECYREFKQQNQLPENIKDVITAMKKYNFSSGNYLIWLKLMLL